MRRSRLDLKLFEFSTSHQISLHVGSPEASAINDAAVAAYTLSVQAGNPLSERRLAQMFGRASRRWARARIADARQAPPLQDPPGIPVTA
jgi:hypothetical protein